MAQLTRFERPQTLDPFRRAVPIAVAYVVVCILYIFLSSSLASAVSTSKEQLQAIEQAKGAAFVLVSGLVILGLSYGHWRRIARQQRTIRNQEQALLAAERRSTAAMCTASIQHDLNNVLMALSGLMTSLDEHGIDDEFMESMREGVQRSSRRLADFVTQLSHASRDVLPERRDRVNLSEAVSDAVELATRHPDVRGCKVIAPPKTGQEVSINSGLFENCLLNLLINASQAGAERVEVRLVEEDGAVRVEVHDDGPGVPEELAGQIFAPCFTTKETGSGLGLLTVKAFAAEHGGSVSVDRSDLGGAVFRISLPRANRSAA